MVIGPCPQVATQTAQHSSTSGTSSTSSSSSTGCNSGSVACFSRGYNPSSQTEVKLDLGADARKLQHYSMVSCISFCSDFGTESQFTEVALMEQDCFALFCVVVVCECVTV